MCTTFQNRYSINATKVMQTSSKSIQLIFTYVHDGITVLISWNGTNIALLRFNVVQSEGWVVRGDQQEFTGWMKWHRAYRFHFLPDVFVVKVNNRKRSKNQKRINSSSYHIQILEYMYKNHAVMHDIRKLSATIEHGGICENIQLKTMRVRSKLKTVRSP